ncbi:hypothetical protein GCM10018952_57030 [Streptosporangium vulgare]
MEAPLALLALLTRLPADLAASVPVVPHLPPRAGSSLAGILGRAGPPEDAGQTGQAPETVRMLQSRIDGTGDSLALT